MAQLGGLIQFSLKVLFKHSVLLKMTKTNLLNCIKVRSVGSTAGINEHIKKLSILIFMHNVSF